MQGPDRTPKNPFDNFQRVPESTAATSVFVSAVANGSVAASSCGNAAADSSTLVAELVSEGGSSGDDRSSSRCSSHDEGAPAPATIDTTSVEVAPLSPLVHHHRPPPIANQDAADDCGLGSPSVVIPPPLPLNGDGGPDSDADERSTLLPRPAAAPSAQTSLAADPLPGSALSQYAILGLDEVRRELASDSARSLRNSLASLRPDDEVQLSSLLHYARFGVSKVEVLRGALPHCILLVLLTVAVLLGRQSETAVVLGESLEVSAFDNDVVTSITTVAEASAFITDDLLPTLFAFDTVAQNRTRALLTPLHDVSVVGVVSIRVHRGRRELCESSQDKFIPSAELDATGGTTSSAQCLGETLENNFTTAFPSGTRVFAGHQMRGFLRQTYDKLSQTTPENLFEIHAPLQIAELGDVVTRASKLLSLRSTDILAIIVETALLDSRTNTLTRVMYLYERRSSATRSTFLSYPFNMVAIDDSPRATVLFVVDVVVLLFGIYTVVEVVFHLRLHNEMRTERDPVISILGWWEFYTMVYALLLLGLFATKMYTWSLSSKLSDAVSRGPADAFAVMMEAHDVSETLYVGLGWLAMLAYVRSFMFLRYSVRLSVINETIGSCLNEMIGVWLILLLVFLSFGLSGVVLWGHRVPEENKTLYNCLIYLFLYLLNGESDNYDSYTLADDISAPIFFLLFFVLCWVVMLNVVVGVLALAFASVTETLMIKERPQWTPVAITRDLRALLRRMPAPIGVPRSSVHTAFLHRRMQLIRAIDLWNAQGVENTISGPEFISLKRFRLYTRTTFPQAFADLVFLKSTQQVGTHNARVRQLRMTHRAINNGVVMNTRLLNQAGLVERIHRKVVIQKRVDAAQAADMMAVASPAFNVTRNDLIEMHRLVASVYERHRWEAEALRSIQVLLKRAAGMAQQAVDLVAERRAPASPGSPDVAAAGGKPPRDRAASAVRQSLFHQHSSAALGKGETKALLTPEEEAEQNRRRAVRAVINDEGDARYDLRAALVAEGALLLTHVSGRLQIAQAAHQGFDVLYATHLEGAAAVRRQVLEARREADESARASRLAEFELRRAESLATLQRQFRQQQQREGADASGSTPKHQQKAMNGSSHEGREGHEGDGGLSPGDMVELRRGVSASIGRSHASFVGPTEPIADVLLLASPHKTSQVRSNADGTFSIAFNPVLMPHDSMGRPETDVLFRRPERPSSFSRPSAFAKAAAGASASSPSNVHGGKKRSGSPPPKPPTTPR